MRITVILPITILCLCGALLLFGRTGTATVEAAARPRSGMELLQAYACHRAETKVVLISGKEDNFSPQGDEPLFLRPGRDTVRVASMVKGGSYDQSQADRGFMDSFRIPARMAKGLFVISLKPVASNETDLLSIGDLESPSRAHRFTKLIEALGNGDGWVVDGALHSAELALVPLFPANPSRTLLDELGDRSEPRWLDVWIQDDTSVDFMGLAACVKPPGGKGLSMSVRPAATEGDEGVVALSCNDGTDDTPICDATFGDAPCGASLPVACLRPGQTPAPRAEHWDRWNWTGGDLALTGPVSASGFASIRDVDRFCARSLGAGWRTATAHDGGRAGGLVGRGQAPGRPTRAWVDIVGSPYATCWSR